ncbi:sigma-54 dependent transcriptional regulator [Myxococcota bacterium]|nr:sigma-54 dependent transcriptional regulator [Myxococcota bacterium]
MTRILVVDDELNIRKVLSALLQREGYEVITACGGDEAKEIARRATPAVDAILTDLRMPAGDGMDLLRFATEWLPDVPVVILTAHGTVDTAVQALKQGAFDYLGKPFDQDEIRLVLAKALRTREANAHSAHPSPAGAASAGGGEVPGLLGRSPALQEVSRLIRKVAASPTTILIHGESGTGKELVATALHRQSDRAQGPIIKLNCTAIPEALFESELFGHERGAFTGAVSSKPGRFELADRGTLFLDEIGELPREMQPKLLRVLQERTFERVGGLKSIAVDVRLVAATNADLEAMVREGAFREDLFYRLNVVPIRLPPLRERREDIPDLADHFVKRFNKRLGRTVSGIRDDALGILVGHSWPGNVRELENVIERAVLLAEGDRLCPQDLPRELLAAAATLAAIPLRAQGAGGSDPGPAASLKDRVREQTAQIERDLIRQALDDDSWNVTRAARRLGLSRKGLQLKMKELGLRRERPEAGGPV